MLVFKGGGGGLLKNAIFNAYIQNWLNYMHVVYAFEFSKWYTQKIILSICITWQNMRKLSRKY